MTVQELFTVVSPLAEQCSAHSQIRRNYGHVISTPDGIPSLRHIQLLSTIERQVQNRDRRADDAFRLTSADKLIQHLHTRLQSEVRE